jgi:hypothetical protein
MRAGDIRCAIQTFHTGKKKTWNMVNQNPQCLLSFAYVLYKSSEHVVCCSFAYKQYLAFIVKKYLIATKLHSLNEYNTLSETFIKCLPMTQHPLPRC